MLGRLDRGWVVASETAALDIVGASLRPRGRAGRAHRHRRATACGQRPSPRPSREGCLFEYVYLARPDTTIAGRSVHAARVEIGRRLAAEHPVEADLVIPVPESGTPAAIGYAQASGIPYGQGLVKNSYVGRTFIQPSQTIRQRGIRLKLNPLKDVIAGQRLVVVDDSIVRGNTQQAIVAMLREAGAARSTCASPAPPVQWPCFYGIDFATRAELIAGSLPVEGIRESIGADSLGYISLAALTEATTVPAGELCRACFDGDYPIPVAEAERGKHILEGAARERAHERRQPGTGHDRSRSGGSYAAAGVSIEAGDRAVALMRDAVARTAGPEVIGGIGGFAGLFDASRLTGYRRPLLATSTDGVGTKVVIAQRLGQYDTVGVDLVAMVVDDLVTCGAEPLFMTDYVVFGSLRPERAAAVVAGVARGCEQAGCALLGGETAEHPGHLGPDDFDLAGAATGVVEADALLGAGRVRPGDVVLALASSGLHANGYSLARQVIAAAGLALDAALPELGRALGAELLTPTRIYARIAWPWPQTATSTPSPTSPAAESPRTWPVSCPPALAPSWTARPGARRPSSVCWPPMAALAATRWSASSTWA